MVGFLSYLCSRNLQTQMFVLEGYNWTLIHQELPSFSRMQVSQLCVSQVVSEVFEDFLAKANRRLAK